MLAENKGTDRFARFVRQPNGRIALYSELGRDFTLVDLTEETAKLYCRDQWGVTPLDAELWVYRCDDGDTDGVWHADGLACWRQCLREIEAAHGFQYMQQRASGWGVATMPEPLDLVEPLTEDTAQGEAPGALLDRTWRQTTLEGLIFVLFLVAVALAVAL